MSAAECPTPAKKCYRSQAEANKAERQWHGPRGDSRSKLYPYLCPTGDHWHLTHRTPEKQRTVFNAETGNPGLSAISNTFEGIRVRHVFTNEPIWIGRDVCDVVGISKYRDALSQLDADERVSIAVDTPGGVQQMTGVTEAGLWSLLLISRSPKVKPFKRWLTHEVLPAIRKNGRYDAVALPDRKTLAQWVVAAEDRAEAAEAHSAAIQPSADAWDRLAELGADYEVDVAAKILSRDSSINIGRNRLYVFMYEQDWVFRGRHNTWKAYQDQVDLERLKMRPGVEFWDKEREQYRTSDPTILITPKGLAELRRLLGRAGGQLELVTA
jgi:anti-repressor protein